MKKVAILLFTMIFSGQVLADPQWYGPAKITKVWTQHGGTFDTFHVQLDAPEINPDSCTYKGWYRITAADSGYNTAVSMLLSAYMTKMPVRIYLSGCDEYPRFTNTEL